MKKYKVGQTVDAVVEKVLPFGVFARLDGETIGYIRHREMNIDTDVDPSQDLQAALPGKVLLVMTSVGPVPEILMRMAGEGVCDIAGRIS
ncbi:MAG: S1 RNA-binding domain-containing protein [Chloroflexi bacterium]|jgi:ribosomal protein S1|nr:S1 RNA-binding domain-containing protein [Chloroflexota bacterium]